MDGNESRSGGFIFGALALVAIVGAANYVYKHVALTPILSVHVSSGKPTLTTEHQIYPVLVTAQAVGPAPASSAGLYVALEAPPPAPAPASSVAPTAADEAAEKSEAAAAALDSSKKLQAVTNDGAIISGRFFRVGDPIAKGDPRVLVAFTRQRAVFRAPSGVETVVYAPRP